jgi:hypothetical protein
MKQDFAKFQKAFLASSPKMSHVFRFRRNKRPRPAFAIEMATNEPELGAERIPMWFREVVYAMRGLSGVDVQAYAC